MDALGSASCLHHHSQRQHGLQHSQACTLLLLPVDLCWEKTTTPAPTAPLHLPLHAALAPARSPFSVSSTCLVRNLSASEAISPCFVYTTALVAFGFCYCRETQILYTLCKIYANPSSRTLILPVAPALLPVTKMYKPTSVQKPATQPLSSFSSPGGAPELGPLDRLVESPLKAVGRPAELAY